MAKKIINIGNFSSGINNNTNARDLEPNEFPVLDGLDNEIPGRLRVSGSVVTGPSYSEANSSAAKFIYGNGLNYITLDRDPGDADPSTNLNATELYLINDYDNANIDLYDATDSAEMLDVISYGTDESPIDSYVIDGQIRMRYPRLMGLRLREVELNGDFFENNYSVKGKFFPPDIGQISLDVEGVLGGGLLARAEAKGVSARWLTKSALQIPKINLTAPPASGSVKGFGELVVEAVSGNIDGQLQALAQSQTSLRKDYQLKRKDKVINPEDIADAVYWIATRPKNININRMEIMAGDQAFNPFNVVKRT